MGKIGVCLKRSFIVVMSIVVIISILLLAFTLFAHGYIFQEEQTDESHRVLYIMYGIGSITLLLSVIGLCGACTEKTWLLIVFTVGMILFSLVIFVLTLLSAAARPKFAEHIKQQFQNVMPLSNVTGPLREHLNQMQGQFQCCGFDQGYLDWGYNISESCLCHENSTHPCVPAPKDSQLFEKRVDDQPVMIYEESCVSYVVAHTMFFMNIGIAVWMGIAFIMVLISVMSIVMLHQLSRKDDVPPVVYSKEAKAGKYDALTDYI
ncbi:tetraspanin-8-like [Thalassophryne amazonica]|uniref:tetraspanin-8-like n=1 Tax=Thalassophryne amazonica TaxID=390379 RepID=UPI0014709BD9|nr:tetraspanin-8-like [Thalassophryne amazonica]